MTALTTRETDVMRLICEGLTAQGIGEVLGISSRTVEIHRRTAIIKLGARNQTQAAVLFNNAQLAEATARAEAAEAENARLILHVEILEEALIDHNCGSPACICVGCIEKRDAALGGEHER
jgi:DNA-binding CsgD family transcriptional regulator